MISETGFLKAWYFSYHKTPVKALKVWLALSSLEKTFPPRTEANSLCKRNCIHYLVFYLNMFNWIINSFHLTDKNALEGLFYLLIYNDETEKGILSGRLYFTWNALKSGIVRLLVHRCTVKKEKAWNSTQL